MLRQIKQALLIFLALSVLTGIIYPLLITGIAQGVFPRQANGSLIYRDGRPVASELIGQAFTDPKYFWSRPSATLPVPYNAGASGGSNLGPANPDLVKAVNERIAALQAARVGRISNPSPEDGRIPDPSHGDGRIPNPSYEDRPIPDPSHGDGRIPNPSYDAPIPVDLVTASGSGLDPHISPAAAEYQVARVAEARGLDEETVRQAVARHTEGRTWGLLGEPRVNVVQLNLDLDDLQR